MAIPSSRRLLAPLAMLTLSTLSCAVMAPGSPGALVADDAGPTSPTVDPPSTPPLIESPSPVLAGASPLAVAAQPDVAPKAEAAATVASTSPPVPQAKPAAAPSIGHRGDAVVEAIHRHLMRYRTRSGLTDAELRRLARTIVAEAHRYDFDPALILAVMHVESRYDTFAVSPKNAMGLMQILPSTGEWMAAKMGVPWHGPQTLFDPFANVRIGVAYLRELANRS